MKLFRKAKDGGPESTVTGYWLIEAKRLFSVCLLKFEDGSRDAYHTHAFDSINWVLKGEVREHVIDELGDHGSVAGYSISHHASLRPVITRRSTFHKVVSKGTTWVLSLRGPWSKMWMEYTPATAQTTVLTHGRRHLKVVP